MAYNKDYNILICAVIIVAALVFFQVNITAVASELYNTSVQKVPVYLKTPAQITDTISLPYTVQSNSPNILVSQNKTNRVVTLDFVTGAGSTSSSSAMANSFDILYTRTILRNTTGEVGLLKPYQSINKNNITIGVENIDEFRDTNITISDGLISIFVPQLNVSGNINLGGVNISLELERLQSNSTLDLTAEYPLIVTGSETRTFTIQPNFTNIRADHIISNQSNNSLGIDLLAQILNLYYGAVSYINISTSKINITSPEINLSASSKINITSPEINLFGIMNINGKNIENELIKTSVKSFQADYLNSSQIYSDLIIIPQDVKLTNITSLIERTPNSTTHLLNISIEKFNVYPTSKTTILNYSMSANQTDFDSIDYNFNNKDIILLNYTTYNNVSKSSSLFKFVVR